MSNIKITEFSCPMQNRLNEILDTMDIPNSRKTDFSWLIRNLFIRNGDHVDFKEAINLIKTGLNGRINTE